MSKRWIVSISRPTWAGFLGLLLLLAPAPAHGQIESWGVKAGVTSMTGGGEGLLDDGLGRNTGFVVGGTATVGVFDFLSLRPELLLVRKSWTASFRSYRGEDLTTTVNLDYLELPVLAEVRLASVRGVSLHAVAGPTVGVMVHSGDEVEGGNVRDDADPEDTLSRMEVGNLRFPDSWWGRGRAGRLAPRPCGWTCATG